jgi:VIT1/CCC1 family predicted Fe2+/Mn2+ transporter
VTPAPGNASDLTDGGERPVGSATVVHTERHLSHRAGWLRAAVLGANDGITSVASLVLGVAAASDGHGAAVTAGVAGLVGGALSMAAGEYVSVSSQRDTETADIARESHELETAPERELDELASIYEAKGLHPELARQVAEELSAGPADERLKVHMAEELGISEATLARPGQAAAVSATSFALGAALPVLAIALVPDGARVAVTVVVALVALAAMGALGARLGGAPPGKAVLRMVLGGGAAMGLTMAIGTVFGTAVG